MVEQGNAIHAAWALLEQVKDPEIPVLSLCELGVLRAISQDATGKLHITLTPTYSGCPALEAMQQDVGKILEAAGLAYKLELQLAPAWTSADISEAGRQKLKAYGIAPPEPKQTITPLRAITCPHCGSHQTELISEFASTACKALFRCRACLEPFDYFKVL